MIGKRGEEEKEDGRMRSLVILVAFLRPRGLTHIYREHRHEERRLMRHSFSRQERLLSPAAALPRVGLRLLMSVRDHVPSAQLVPCNQAPVGADGALAALEDLPECPAAEFGARQRRPRS